MNRRLSVNYWTGRNIDCLSNEITQDQIRLIADMERDGFIFRIKKVRDTAIQRAIKKLETEGYKIIPPNKEQTA